MKQTQRALETLFVKYKKDCDSDISECFDYWNDQMEEINTSTALEYCPESFKVKFRALYEATDTPEKLSSALVGLLPEKFWSSRPDLNGISHDVRVELSKVLEENKNGDQYIILHEVSTLMSTTQTNASRDRQNGNHDDATDKVNAFLYKFKYNLLKRLMDLPETGYSSLLPMIERIKHEMKVIPDPAIADFLEYNNPHEQTWLQHQYVETVLKLRDCEKYDLLKRKSEFDAVHKIGRELLNLTGEENVHFAQSMDGLTASSDEVQQKIASLAKRLHTSLIKKSHDGESEIDVNEIATALGTGHFAVAIYAFVSNVMAPNFVLNLEELFIFVSTGNKGTSYRAVRRVASRTRIFLTRILNVSRGDLQPMLKCIHEFLEFAWDDLKFQQGQAQRGYMSTYFDSDDNGFKFRFYSTYIGSKGKDTKNFHVLLNFMTAAERLITEMDQTDLSQLLYWAEIPELDMGNPLEEIKNELIVSQRRYTSISSSEP